jgi:serine/threonine protein kinase
MLESFAPEQLGVLDSVPDRRSDVHGLGAILFELLVGHPPFRPLHDVSLAPTRRLLAIPGLRVPTPSESFVALDASRRRKIARDRSLGEDDLLAVLREWDRVIARALARDPDARPPTAAELAEEMEKRL